MRGPLQHHPVFADEVLLDAKRWLEAQGFATRFKHASMKPEWHAAEQVLAMEEFKVYGHDFPDGFIMFHLMDIANVEDEEGYEFSCFVYKLWSLMQEESPV